MNPRKKLSILFIEDSADDMELLLNALREEYSEIFHRRVEDASSLRAALETIKWDLIICDHNMPALDAPSALRIVQEKHEEIPLIIASGLMSPHAAAAAMMAGAADMVSKDDLSRLIPAVKRELKRVSIIGDLKLTRAEIDRIAYYDQLTGLPNREYLAKKTMELIEAGSSHEGMAMLMININRFMQIPRSMGLRTANLALQIIAQRIFRCVSDIGTSASLGGDRFAVLIPRMDGVSIVTDAIENIRQKLGKAITVDAQEFFLSCTVGVSLYPRDGSDFNELLGNAETAMYQARDNSSCNYLFFEPGISAAGQEQVIMEHALHRAIQNKEFLLHYQPQYDLLSGKMTGVEALLRWQPAEGSLIPPDKFIPLLEETGLIVAVGEWVLRTACAQNRAWQKMGLPPIRVAVNLSVVQFRQADLIPMVRRVLEQTGLEPRYLELEITENVAMHNEEAMIAALRELHEMGIGLAIDDFGTGYSSLSYLKRFPVHKLKIDRSFVMDISEQEDSGSLVKGIVSLAHNLGLSVIAEGVETEIQASFLRTCGCAEAQGYLYSRPVCSDVIEKYLSELLEAV
jgi:diguanylate cyclase (GGDEF)-like protein